MKNARFRYSSLPLAAGMGALLVLLTGCGSGGGYIPPGSMFDWSIQGSGDRLTIQPGQQAVWPIIVRSKTDIESTVRFRAESVPPGATASFNPANLGTTGDESALSIQTSAQTPIGTYTIRVIAEEVGRGEYSISLLLTVAGDPGAVDFSLEVTPLQYNFYNGGGNPTVTYYVRPLNGFLGTVNIAVNESSPYLTIAQGPTPPSLIYADAGGQGGTFVIRADDYPLNAPPVDVTVTATSGAIVHTGTIRIFFGPQS